MFKEIKCNVIDYINKNFSVIFYIITSIFIFTIVKILISSILPENNVKVFTHYNFLFFTDKLQEIINYIMGAGVFFLMFILYPIYKKFSEFSTKCPPPPKHFFLILLLF